MEFLECKICNIPYDEEDRRPRNAPCGHEWCSTCIRELIQDSVFLCPKCRQKNKVDVPDDLPVNYGLIDVIRAFKSQYISLPQKTEPIASEVSSEDICKVHHKTFMHRCLKCLRWLCDSCVKSHTKLTGCLTISSSEAMKNIKEEQSESIDMLLSTFEEGSTGMSSKILQHSDLIVENNKKIKELQEQSEIHKKEIQKIENLLEEGKQKSKDILKSKEDLNDANSPSAVMNEIEVLEEKKQELRGWSITNLGIVFPNDKAPYDISKLMKENQEAYVEMIVNYQRKIGRLTKCEDNNIYFQCSREMILENPNWFYIPLGDFQKSIPSSPLAFIQLSYGSIVQGQVNLRLMGDLPNITEHLIQLLTGQKEHTLIGTTFAQGGRHCIFTKQLEFKKMSVKVDSNARKNGKKGDVMGCYRDGYLDSITIQTSDHTYINRYVIAHIEEGMDIIKQCHDTYKWWSSVITDSGLVF